MLGERYMTILRISRKYYIQNFWTRLGLTFGILIVRSNTADVESKGLSMLDRHYFLTSRVRKQIFDIFDVIKIYIGTLLPYYYGILLGTVS